MKISIKEILKSEVALFHGQGLLMFEHLEKCILENTKVSLSFEGTTSCTTQFMMASIGKLYFKYDKSTVERLLDFTNVPSAIESRLNRVIQNALQGVAYDKMIHEAASKL